MTYTHLPDLDTLAMDVARCWVAAAGMPPGEGVCLAFASAHEAKAYSSRLHGARRNAQAQLDRQYAEGLEEFLEAPASRTSPLPQSTGWDRLTVRIKGSTLWVGQLTAANVGLQKASTEMIRLEGDDDDDAGIAAIERAGAAGARSQG